MLKLVDSPSHYVSKRILICLLPRGKSVTTNSIT